MAGLEDSLKEGPGRGGEVTGQAAGQMPDVTAEMEARPQDLSSLRIEMQLQMQNVRCRCLELSQLRTGLSQIAAC